jgi:hypothetical protein
MSGLLDALQYVGETLDKPGAALRGLLAGRPDQLLNLLPFSDTVGITDPSERVSGRGLLEQYGMLGANRSGLDIGDVAGFFAEEALDPVNWIPGGYLVKHGLRWSAGVDDLAALMRTTDGAVPAAALGDDVAMNFLMGAKGTSFSPLEVANVDALTRQQRYQNWLRSNVELDESGNPLMLYHGTDRVFDEFSPDFFGSGAGGNRAGAGVYLTDSPHVASEYADNTFASMRNGEVIPKNVRMQYVKSPIAKANSSNDDIAEMHGRTAADGYTGIRHTGGNLMGTATHNAYVVFNPTDVLPANPNPQQLELLANRWRLDDGSLPFSLLAGMLGAGGGAAVYNQQQAY